MRKLLTAYAVWLVLLPTLWLGFGETYTPLVVTRYLPQVLWLVPLIPLLPFLRRKSDAIIWLSLTIFVLVYHMGFCLPWEASGQANLRVLTFNMKEGLAGDISPFLLANQLDIIALQEARVPEEGVEGPDPVPTLRQAMAGYQMARGGIGDELVIFSAHPMVDSWEMDLGGESQALIALVSVSGKTVRVVNVHIRTGDIFGRWHEPGWFLASAQRRAVQFSALEQLLADGQPTLLMGDFNIPPNSDGSALFSKYLRDNFWVAGFGYGYTFPDGFPALRIDYIWSSPEIGVVSSKVLKPHQSDHRPLLSELAF